MQNWSWHLLAHLHILGQPARLEASPWLKWIYLLCVRLAQSPSSAQQGTGVTISPSACLGLWVNHKPSIFHPQSHKNNPHRGAEGLWRGPGLSFLSFSATSPLVTQLLRSRHSLGDDAPHQMQEVPAEGTGRYLDPSWVPTLQ